MPFTSSKADLAATTIQRHFRGFLSRKKYPHMYHLPRATMEEYHAFAIGNDPCITGLAQYRSDEKMALVATSGFRAILLACQLNNHASTPKIFIVDNSRMVYDLWKQFREFVSVGANCIDDHTFIQSLNIFLRDRSGLVREFERNEFDHPDVEYPEQNIPDFFKSLFKKYGFKNVCNIIRQATIIRQTWSDKVTFQSLKAIISSMGIHKTYTYSSNIIECMIRRSEPTKARAVVSNISILNPALSIFTYCDSKSQGSPSKIIFAKDQNMNGVIGEIEAEERQRPTSGAGLLFVLARRM